MSINKAELLLHPVRVRIAAALSGGRELTARQVLTRMPGIPQATVYRHLRILREAGLIRVVRRIKVRGTEELILTLGQDAATFGPGDFENLPPHGKMSVFRQFLALVQTQFEDWANLPTADPRKDGLGFHQVLFWLSDEELADFGRKLKALITAAEKLESGPDRRLRYFTAILVPDVDKGENHNERQ